MALKCADLGHLALPSELHKMWVTRLQDEFYAQGDQERKLNLSVSALMERGKASLCSSQVLIPVLHVHLPFLIASCDSAHPCHERYLTRVG